MDRTTLTLTPRQRLVLESVLEHALDAWLDRSPDEGETTLVRYIQALADMHEKLDMPVPKEARLFLADRR